MSPNSDENSWTPVERAEQAGVDSNSDSNTYSDDVAKQERRFSNHSGMFLPEVVSADTYQGIEVVKDDHKELAPVSSSKEALHLEHLPEVYDEGGKERSAPIDAPVDREAGFQEKPLPNAPKDRLNRKFCGIRAKWILVGLAALIVFIIALGVGLGVGLKSKHTPGAYSGTKIALVTQTFAADSPGGAGESLVMYFQHKTGNIRWMRLLDSGQWIGGDSSTVVAVDAMNGTPISAVSYTWDGNAFYRVYYIDYTGILREVWQNTVTIGWTLGPLSDMNIMPFSSSTVGMVACWYGPVAGDQYSEGRATTSDASDLDIRLVYANTPTSFQQLFYTGETQVYTLEQTLTGLNGQASPACYNQAPGTVDYLMFLDEQNAVNLYWRDMNTSMANTTSHPINVWTKSSISIANVDHYATLGYVDYLYAQDASNYLIGAYDISFASENSTWKTNSDFVVQGDPGIPGTGLGITARPQSGGSDEVFVFYQTNNNDIVSFKRGIDGGDWSSSIINIPS